MTLKRVNPVETIIIEVQASNTIPLAIEPHSHTPLVVSYQDVVYKVVNEE